MCTYACTFIWMQMYKLLYHSVGFICEVLICACVDGTDFIFVPHNITFPAGSISNAFSISIQDDVLFELSETFNATLLTYPSSRPISIANGTTTVVIVDNDRKYFKIKICIVTKACHKILIREIVIN